jgi:hypothetical protein
MTEPIKPGHIYLVEQDGQTFRVMPKRESTLIPGWWNCPRISPGAPELLPATAFVKLADEQPIT